MWYFGFKLALRYVLMNCAFLLQKKSNPASIQSIHNASVEWMYYHTENQYPPIPRDICLNLNSVPVGFPQKYLTEMQTVQTATSMLSMLHVRCIYLSMFHQISRALIYCWAPVHIESIPPHRRMFRLLPAQCWLHPSSQLQTSSLLKPIKPITITKS